MKTIWTIILTGAAVLAAGGPAFAENQPLTCWYNDHADFTSAENAAVAATVGAVTRYGSGDKTYNYTILARDGTACPVQLPLSSLTAVTVALVPQDDGSCGNENVVDNGTAAVGGSVTVAHSTDESSTAGGTCQRLTWGFTRQGVRIGVTSAFLHFFQYPRSEPI